MEFCSLFTIFIYVGYYDFCCLIWWMVMKFRKNMFIYLFIYVFQKYYWASFINQVLPCVWCSRGKVCPHAIYILVERNSQPTAKSGNEMLVHSNEYYKLKWDREWLWGGDHCGPCRQRKILQGEGASTHIAERWVNPEQQQRCTRRECSVSGGEGGRREERKTRSE